MSDDAHASEQGDAVLEDQSRQDEAEAAEASESAAPPEAAVALLEDRLRRALADLDNLRKRYEREVERERLTERMQVARQWLPVVDDLEPRT